MFILLVNLKYPFCMVKTRIHLNFWSCMRNIKLKSNNKLIRLLFWNNSPCIGERGVTCYLIWHLVKASIENDRNRIIETKWEKRNFRISRNGESIKETARLQIIGNTFCYLTPAVNNLSSKLLFYNLLNSYSYTQNLGWRNNFLASLCQQQQRLNFICCSEYFAHLKPIISVNMLKIKF